jgi:hypothetical protein
MKSPSEERRYDTPIRHPFGNRTNVYEHTERLLSASAHWLEDATVETLSENGRISAAFVGGYNALQAVRPPLQGELWNHPLTSVVTAGTKLLELSKADLNLGLALVAWDDYGKYQLEPAPASVELVVDWAERVRNAALRLKASQ